MGGQSAPCFFSFHCLFTHFFFISIVYVLSNILILCLKSTHSKQWYECNKKHRWHLLNMFKTTKDGIRPSCDTLNFIITFIYNKFKLGLVSPGNATGLVYGITEFQTHKQKKKFSWSERKIYSVKVTYFIALVTQTHLHKFFS